MTESIFIHMDAVRNDAMDLAAFQRAFRRKYTEAELHSAADTCQYCLEWSAKSGSYMFSGMLDQRRVTFVIDYFDSPDRERDLAEQILWLRRWFPETAQVIVCDDRYETVYALRPDTEAEDLIALLKKQARLAST